jgi:hypothetical protein
MTSEKKTPVVHAPTASTCYYLHISEMMSNRKPRCGDCHFFKYGSQVYKGNCQKKPPSGGVGQVYPSIGPESWCVDFVAHERADQADLVEEKLPGVGE